MRPTTARSIGLLLAAAVLGAARPAYAVGTVFTYQGQLQQGGSPHNGNCDFQFRLFDALSAGNPVGSQQAVNDVAVANGLFAVQLNFGAVFTGPDRWLEIAPRCPAGSGTFTTLTPRQPVTAVPYALLSSTVPTDAIASAQIAPGTIVTSDLADASVTDAKVACSGSLFVTASKERAASESATIE